MSYPTSNNSNIFGRFKYYPYLAVATKTTDIMTTLETLNEKLAVLNEKMISLSKEQKRISEEIMDTNHEIYSLKKKAAMDIAPFKEGDLVMINGKEFEVSFVEMSWDDQLHIAFAQMTKKGYRNMRTYPKHLFIYAEDMQYIDTTKLKTTDNEVITKISK